MPNFLYVLNLFPYTQLWRIGNRSQHNNKCSLIFSILVFLLVGALTIWVLIRVFSRNELTVVNHTIAHASPPKKIVNTHQDDQHFHPFMLAFNISASSQQFNPSQLPLNITAYVDNVFAGNSYQTDFNTSIGLEPCTAQHFSKLPNADLKFVEWNASQWSCLPINQSYEI